MIFISCFKGTVATVA